MTEYDDFEDPRQPLLPLDERFRRAEQLDLDLFPDYADEQEETIARRVKRWLGGTFNGA